jgi:protoheme IX farnesyltransferase
MNRIVTANSPLWKKLVSLTKPGIIGGNLLPMLAGFFMATGGRFDFTLFPALIGTIFVIASGCVFNNFIDRDIDPLMERTKNRLLAKKEFSLIGALIFGSLLGFVGLWALFSINVISAICGAIGLFVYVILYSLFTKRNTVYSIHVGSISGAVPPLIGYVSIIGAIDLGGILLFLILTLWQMPHSFAISIFRAKDYAKVGISSIVTKKGMLYTKASMLCYIILFSILNASLTFFDFTGKIHFLNATLVGIYWIYLSISGFKTQDEPKWGRKMFFTSIIIITLSCITIGFF